MLYKMYSCIYEKLSSYKILLLYMQSFFELFPSNMK
jgi:hypothetical protein